MNILVPKQFLILAGKPVVMHSMQAFSDAIPDISMVLVLPPGQFGQWEKLCMEYSFNLPHKLVPGGPSRFHSVQNALPALSGDDLVAIHDGARPLVSAALIHRVFNTALLLGNCIPVIPVNETVRRVSGETSTPADRNSLRLVQTPQVFYSSILRKGYEQPYREQFTDDAMVMESIGETIHLAEGEPFNLKITHKHDLELAESLYKLLHP